MRRLLVLAVAVGVRAFAPSSSSTVATREPVRSGPWGQFVRDGPTEVDIQRSLADGVLESAEARRPLSSPALDAFLRRSSDPWEEMFQWSALRPRDADQRRAHQQTVRSALEVFNAAMAPLRAGEDDGTLDSIASRSLTVASYLAERAVADGEVLAVALLSEGFEAGLFAQRETLATFGQQHFALQ